MSDITSSVNDSNAPAISVRGLTGCGRRRMDGDRRRTHPLDPNPPVVNVGFEAPDKSAARELSFAYDTHPSAFPNPAVTS